MQFALAGWSRQIPHIEGVIAHDPIAKDSDKEIIRNRGQKEHTHRVFLKVSHTTDWTSSLNCNDHHWPVFWQRRSDLENCTLDCMFAVFCGVMWDGMCRNKTSPEGYRRIKERLFQMSMANLMFVVGVVGVSFVVLSRSHLSEESGGITLFWFAKCGCRILPNFATMSQNDWKQDIELLSDRQKFFPRCWGTGTTIESAACLQHCCRDV